MPTILLRRAHPHLCALALSTQLVPGQRTAMSGLRSTDHSKNSRVILMHVPRPILKIAASAYSMSQATGEPG